MAAQMQTQQQPTPQLPIDTILHGDSLEVLRSLPDACVDAIVTDPPAGISFMGKRWDSDHGGRDAWIAWLAEVMRETLRVVKPGGHALVWALPRTSHWTAMALEDAGFEVRDCVTHLFGSGFPKSLDVSKAIDKQAGAKRERLRGVRSGVVASTYAHDAWSLEYKDSVLSPEPITDAAQQWDGWGTALKPAVEDWWLCRKPLAEGTVAANVLTWGTGALNIGASRVGSEAALRTAGSLAVHRATYGGFSSDHTPRVNGSTAGRWPANLLLSHAPDCEPTRCSLWCPVRELDAQSGIRTSGLMKAGTKRQTSHFAATDGNRLSSDTYGDTGGASRYFSTFRYVPKASRSERNRGCSSLPEKSPWTSFDGQYAQSRNPVTGERLGEYKREQSNHHPTVKPLALMSWLIGLITPPGGLVLDPFAGSGSTLVAAHEGGWRYLGI